VVLGACLFAAPARAQESSYQCMRRVGTTLNVNYWWGKLAPSADAGTPQQQVPALLKDPNFAKRWAAFVNSKVNAQPGLTAEDDVMTAVIQYTFANDLPWRDVFVGRFALSGPSGYPKIAVDAAQPPWGFFGLTPWLRRYAGNASDGRMLQASYRVMRATIGLDLVPSPQNATGDASASGRERPECRSCHYDSPYALDHVAQLLPFTRSGIGNQMKLVPQTATPQVLFNGQTVQSFDDLLQRLVSSDAFSFWSCRLAFEFTMGRKETGCEAPLFDRCVDALNQTGDIRAGIAAIMQDPSYCAELY